MTSQGRHNHDCVQNSRFSVKYRPKLQILLKSYKLLEFRRGFNLYENKMKCLINKERFKTMKSTILFLSGDF